MPLNVRPRALAAALGLVLLSAAASAQVVPKTIRLVVAYPSGGVSDVVARALADKLSAQLGSTLVVENKAGASGTIGMDAVAKAVPDGATLGFSAISPLVLNPHVGRSPFDPLKDIAPVASVMYSPVLLMATPATGTRDLRSLLDDARARPGAVRWATSGQASLGHIVLEQLRSAAKVDITHIPYKGGAPAMTDLIAGRIDYWCPFSTTAMPQIKGDTVKPIAIFALQRLAVLPDLPTAHEQGLANFEASTWNAMFLPKGTPPAIVQKLHDAVVQAVATAPVQQRLRELGMSPAAPDRRSPEYLARFIPTEIEKWAAPIKASGISVD